MGNIYKLGNKQPKLGKECFVAPGALVFGDVIFGDEVSFWFNSIARGDVDKITIGDFSNIQDLVMLHVSQGAPLNIGKGVSVGHHVTLHGCTVENYCLIGMGATLLDGSVIGSGSVVAAGSLIPPGKVYPPNKLIMGNPGRVVRDLTTLEKNEYHNHYKTYLITKNDYLNNQPFELVR